MSIETTEIRVAKAGKTYTFDWYSLPEVTRDHVILYGLRQIMNDSTASAPTGETEEGRGLADKRYDALISGVLRASSTREGDPVRRRAIELATAAVTASPKFTAWLVASKLKKSDKDAQAKLAELAKGLVAVEGNKYTTQAKIDVEAAKSLGEVDIEI